MSNDQQAATTINQELTAILGDRVLFRPCAYYDKHMDCIRIELRDCSVKELRLSELLTVHMDNDPEDGQSQYVGLTIKGVKHVFTELNLPLEGIIRITEILNRLSEDFAKALQNTHEKAMARDALHTVTSFARHSELKVDMNSTSLALAA